MTQPPPITRQDIRLLAFDLDDTALNTGKQLTPAVAGAIAAAIQSGVHTLPATGRQLEGIPPAVLAVPGVRYALTANGARVYDLADGSVIHQDTFSRPLALRVAARLKACGCHSSVYIQGTSYTDNPDVSDLAGLLTPQVLEYLRTSRVTVPSIITLLETSPHPVDKFSVHFSDMEQKQTLWQELDGWGQVAITSSVPTNIEINTLTANKGAGMKALAAHLGIPIGQVMAVGDSSNDTEMIRAVGYGVAMRNAAEEVKAVADAITLSDCNHDGLGEAIRLVLGLWE